ncbi:zinc finger protein 462-like isoform X2 [Sparus aurata]|uniref:Zinc finger protein 462-like n=1 Tax=Sparus aurata TaxID=8175 RepID=A0A671UHS9_SPAAU|nr:zinc finger protein 462-like isoform X2 [Sparus aurata]
MQSVHLSSSGHNRAQESPNNTYQCSHCPLILKSKIYLFEHLNKEHGFDVDAALRDAGLKNPGTAKASTDDSSLGNNFECLQCDFKAGSQDVLNEHEKRCQIKSEDRNMIGNPVISENQETKNKLKNEHREAAGAKAISSGSSVKPTSKTKSMLNSSKDVKTYKRPLQTITKYFKASGSNRNPPAKLADSSKETLLLQESPSDSSPSSSGVFKVTAKPTIDITGRANYCFLLDDQLQITDLRAPKPKQQLTETAPDNIGKRSSNTSSNHPPAKKAKSDKDQAELQEDTNASKQQSTSNTELAFEFSEDEEEKKVNLVNGDMGSAEVYFCKHCDFSDVSIRSVSTHYQNDHPYIRYTTVYIQDPGDQSATFRCLECPVEFSRVADLKRHYTENHQEAPSVFTVQSSELCLLFKCFVCPFTTNALKALKEHYKEEHPIHNVDNSLMYCRFSTTRCQEEQSELNTCEKAASPDKPPGISHGSAHTPCKEVNPTSKAADVAMYHCTKCEFSHKSVVVMHVHYQKSHPDEAVTIDKIKQSGQNVLHTSSQITPDNCPKSVTVIEKSTPQKKIMDRSKRKRNKAELSQQKDSSLSMINPKQTTEASKTPPESDKTETMESAREEKKSPTEWSEEMSPGIDRLNSSETTELLYCQFCTYSSTKIKSVAGHHNAKHSAYPTYYDEILWYSAEVRKKKLEAKAKASARAKTSKTKSSKQVEVSSEQEPRREEDKPADDAYACAENLFYCQKCNYGNPTPQGVLNHQAKGHQNIKGNMEQVIEYTALIRSEIEKSKLQAKNLSFSGYLPLPLVNEGDENMFFCHFCNYRHSNLPYVMVHFMKQHRGFGAQSAQVSQYTSMVHSQTQKSHLKTTVSQEDNHAPLERTRIKKKKKMKLSKGLASPLIGATEQTQRSLQCHRCAYSTQTVSVLRRHLWKTHRANRSVMEVLKVCFRQGNVQTGYHCDLCVFSHEEALAIYKHYQEQHPVRKLSLDYVKTRLYVSPETCSSKRKRPQTKQSDGISEGNGTDGSSLSQRSGQNEAKMYSCKACSFKSSSMSGITSHYRAVHPWSVKEDGSVLDVTDSKRQSANQQLEDHNERPVSFDTYQAPLEFENSPGSSHKAAPHKKAQKIKCPFCPASFPTKHGLSVHCGMKHHEGVSKNLDTPQEEQEQIQNRVHVFKCPHCTYVNTNYQGVLTHCQMRHPALISRADSLYVDEAHLHNWEDCVKSNGPGFKLCGYMCETCPQICASLEKLNKHFEEGHNETEGNTVPNEPKSAPPPSAVGKRKKHKSHVNQGSVSKASFFNKKTYVVLRCQSCSYQCTTKLGLARHLQIRHKNASLSKVLDGLYKCALCSNFYFKKKRLGSHYAKKHGKEAFLKYYAPVYKQVLERSTPTAPDCPVPQRPEDTEDKSKKIVYKCPSCPYVNASYHGTLTHCQMKHPDVLARADELQTCEILVTDMVECKKGKGFNERGYMCQICPQIHVSLKKLKIHQERYHNPVEATAPEHSVEVETEEQPNYSSVGTVSEAFSLNSGTPEMSTTEIDTSQEFSTPETCQSNTTLVQDKKPLYKCRICPYMGSIRKYLYCHYKNTHKLDSFNTCKLLERYNKRKARKLPKPKPVESAQVKCKMCPDLTFDSSQLLIDHFSTCHNSDRMLDFIVLSQASTKTTGLYKCALCNKQMNGIRKLSLHLDRHRETAKEMSNAAMTKASLVIKITPEAKTIEPSREDELPLLETVEDLAQWNVTPVETFTAPQSPPSSPMKLADQEQSGQDSREDELTCKQCGRTFMSLRGLHLHERSHAAVAAIKKQNNLSTSALKQNINKYVVYKTGTLRPFLCSFCTFRTTVMDLWRSHFMKKHQDVIMGFTETDNQDEESPLTPDKEPPYSSEGMNNLSEPEEEPEITERSLYLEPPDVQRQLNHYSLMAKAGAASKANVQETQMDNRLLYCEVCNFNTEYLSSMRRHYLNRHGKKIFRCKDCDYFTGSRKTLEMHVETGHSTCQSKPTHQRDLRCPFCLYQTKNKNNMIDHIVLHREERVVPIEVRRPKLSRYLQGIVFRCHKCTFTCGSPENLRLHMTRHDDIKPYKCRLCYFDCPQLGDLEAHLSDKHQVLRNHELVGQMSLDQLEARVGRMPEEEEEPLSDLECLNNDREDVKTEVFVTDCDEVPHDAQAESPAEDNDRENVTLELNKAGQKQRQDGKNGHKESPVKTSVLEPQYENTKLNPTIKENNEQEPQEQAKTVFLPNNAKGQEIEDIEEQKVHEGFSKDIHYENREERQTKENRVQTKVRDGEDSRVTQQKEEVAEGSSTTYEKRTQKAPAQKPCIKALNHRTLNIEARVEDDVLRQIFLLDEDGSIRTIHKKPDLDKTVKTEKEIEQEVVNNILNEIQLLDGAGSITLAHNRKNQVNTESASASAKTNQRNVLTLGPNGGLIKVSQKRSLGVLFTNCKEKQVEDQKNCEEPRDNDEEMPELEDEYLEEEKGPLGSCKEQDETDEHELKQDKEDEMITEDDGNQCTNRGQQESEGTKEAENPPVPKGALTVTDGASTEEKLFTCDLCGRNLVTSSELKQHIVRHGI